MDALHGAIQRQTQDDTEPARAAGWVNPHTEFVRDRRGNRECPVTLLQAPGFRF
jgi:hypothetical protein